MAAPDFPIDIAMEASLLGSILKRNSILDDHTITRDFFYNLENREIYDTIMSFHARNAKVDEKSVTLLIPSRWKEIDYCVQNSVGDIDGCVKKLQSVCTARKIYDLWLSIEAMLKDHHNNLIDTDDMQETISQKLFGILEAQASSYRSFSEAATSALCMIEERFRHGSGITGIPSGITRLDDWTDGFQDGDYVLIGARPSVGKTAFALSILLKAASKNNRVAFLSLEMKPEYLVYRLLSATTSVTVNEMRKGRVNTEQVKQLQNSIANLVSPERIFFGENRGMTIDEIISQARLLKRREKIDALFIDYLGLIALSSRGKKRWEEMGEISNRLKTLAMQLDIPVIVLSQLGREADGKRPSLANLRDSGALEQDADVVILLHADEQKPNELKLMLAKHRQGETGIVDLYYNKIRQTFAEVERTQIQSYTNRWEDENE